ncbi:ATPase family AAA domain-containing protein 5b [Eucyclogobius newberryi]|uniref:ATPase family AAA domain-containing protein 5b n=1 Tax=Eucyclogobius newberryi TaxID=166745 RepID=UPI003B5C6D9C
MRSKLKRSKSCKNARCSNKNQGQTTQVIDISSESGCADVDTAHVKDVTPWNNKQHFSNTDSNCTGLAPIFSRTTNASKGVNGSGRPHIIEADSFTCQEPDKLPISDLHVRLRDVKVSPVNNIFSHLHEKGCQQGHDFTSGDKEHFQPVQNNVHQDKAHGTSCVAEEVCTTTATFAPSHIVQEGPTSTPEKHHRTNRLSRTRTLRQRNEPENENTEEAESDQQSTKKTTVVFQREPFSEDVLWTDKYRPRHSSGIIGNVSAVGKLHSWLMKWKRRSNAEDENEKRKNEAQSNDSWDCGDFEDEVGSEDGTEKHLCNTVLISGPPGVGKTASVYACAAELGFKVFEVNCSSQRSGREVLAQLKEATQSHLVEISSKDPLKPAFFNSYNTARSSLKSDTLPAKTTVKASVSTCKKKRAQKREESAKPITLTSYFKTKAKADDLNRKTGASPCKNPTKCTDQDGTASKNVTTSLILFEEVDVIFEDDVGFLAAIKTFMRTTKRPVVLTTSDPLFGERFNSSLDEIVFQTPSMAVVCSYLQLVCLAEKAQVDPDDVKTLFTVTRGDVRRCLLQLQLWTNTAGHGRRTFNEGEFTYKGCSANMLGLQSVNENNLLQLLRAPLWTPQQMTEILLPMTESWRNGFPLLYANLGLLLHFNANELGNAYRGSGGKMLFCDTKQIETFGRYSTRSTAETKSRLSRKKNILSPPMSYSPTPQTPQCATDKLETANGLTALSDFFDLASFIDATVPAAAPCNIQEFVWTGAKIQDGFLDEMKEEEDKNDEMMLDFGATLEALGFHRCWRQVSDKVQKFRRGETSNHKNLNLITQHLDPFIVSQRFDLSRRILSGRYFSLLHNKRAVCIDYLPAIRFICRTHRKWRKRRQEELFRCVKALRTHLRLAKETVHLLECEFS